MTTHELIERLNSHMGKQDVSVLLADCREAAQALSTLTAEVEELREVVRLMPDEIEVFRIMQATGGKRADMAKAVGRRIEELRATLTKGETK